MRATIPIALSKPTRLLRIERVVDEDRRRVLDTGNGSTVNVNEGTWRIWINANYDFTLGTQLVLYPDGRIDNATQNEDGTETIFEVKGHD